MSMDPKWKARHDRMLYKMKCRRIVLLYRVVIIRRRNGAQTSSLVPHVPIFRTTVTRFRNILRRRSHKAGADVNGNGHGRGPSEEERRRLAEQARRFEHDFRELAKH